MLNGHHRENFPDAVYLNVVVSEITFLAHISDFFGAYWIVDVFALREIFVLKEDAVAPIVAHEAVLIVYLVPTIPVEDFIVAQESLKDHSVGEISF